jgi:hypothetical protein
MANSSKHQAGASAIDPRAAWRAALHLACAAAIICASATNSIGAGAPTPGDYAAVSDVGDRAVPSMESPATVARQMSTRVSGALTTRGGDPVAGQELHFESPVTGNLYTVRTRAGGAFFTSLPPGVYNLRGKHGAMIATGVVVGQSPVDLGRVHSPAGYDIRRFFDWQHVAQSLVHSPAPATAYLPRPGATAIPIAVTPMHSPPVTGGGPNGQRLPPAEVMSPQVEQETVMPAESGAASPAPGQAGGPPSGSATGAGY